ncbi:MAG TPA: hypothetical protein VGL72_16035 [Bryobacteraceae bacterium]
MLERRWERRLLCADLVRIEWKDEMGQSCKLTALLEDISPSGACLQTDSPIPVNAALRVRHGKSTLLEGTVSYCAYHEIGYFTGVTFTAKRRWSRRLFRPKHLVDPVKLDMSESSSG